MSDLISSQLVAADFNFIPPEDLIEALQLDSKPERKWANKTDSPAAIAMVLASQILGGSGEQHWFASVFIMNIVCHSQPYATCLGWQRSYAAYKGSSSHSECTEIKAGLQM